MAKTFYVPVNGLSKRTKQWYIPVNGLSKKVKKAYAPKNGLSKLFWDGGGWRREADIPYNFYGGCAVVYKGKIHLLGGEDYPTRHYSWNGSSWVNESTLPYNLVLGSAVVWNDKIHILGSSSALGAHYSWDGSSWTQEARVPVNFYGENNAVIYDGYIHTISSWWGRYGNHRYVCKYDGTAWTSVINPANNSYASSASYGGKIYLLGASGTGGAGYQEYEDGVYGSVKTIPYQFSGGFALVYNGKIHMLGSAQRYVTKYHFGFDGTDFDSKSTMPYDFYYCPAVVYRGRIHIFGGNNNRTEHWSYGEDVGAIYSNLYPTANVSRAGIITQNNGSRSPVTKSNDGDCVCYAIRNGQGSAYGGNWIITLCIALSRDAALLVQPGTGAGVGSHTINGVTYYYGLQSSNPSWGGATQVLSPIDIPIFDDWYMCEPGGSISQAKFIEIIERLGIEVVS